MPQLSFEKTSPCTALEISLTTESIGLFHIGLIVDQLPWTTMSRGEAFTCLVVSKPIAKVTRVADVKTVIAYRPKYIDVMHQLSVTLGA